MLHQAQRSECVMTHKSAVDAQDYSGRHNGPAYDGIVSGTVQANHG